MVDEQVRQAQKEFLYSTERIIELQGLLSEQDGRTKFAKLTKSIINFHQLRLDQRRNVIGIK